MATAVARIDPRNARFTASTTLVVLIVALVMTVVSTPVTIALLVIQAIVSALGGFYSVAKQPYGWLFRHVIRPRLAPPLSFQDPKRVRQTHVVVLALSVIAVLGLLIGFPLVGQVALGAAILVTFLSMTLFVEKAECCH